MIYNEEVWRLKHEIDRLNAELQARDKAKLDAMLAPENVQASLDRWVAKFDRAGVSWSVESYERPKPPKNTWKIIAKVSVGVFLILMYPVLIVLRYA